MGKLGYSSLTLTDITETIPISLTLQSNLGNNVQTRTGSIYSPDFTEEELIITPLLYMGSSQIEVPTGDKGEIYYEITGEGEKQFTKSGTSTTDSIYVDESGRLHFKKNLSTSITIEAYVRDYENEEHGYSIELIGAANPITILYLDEGKSGGYSMTIEATRTYFNSTAKKPIYLTAHVYKGTEEITNNVSYEWDTISDDDDGGSTDFVSYDKQIEVNRNDVSRQEIFQCAVTLTDGSNLRFSDQIIIQDFLDDIYSDIMADGSLVLTPKNMSVTLTNRVYDATGRINENGDTESYKFTYTWKLLRSDTETDIAGETGSSITIDLTKGTFSTLRENFSIACIATVNGEKARTVAFVNIFYSAISIDVNATSSVAINVDKDGNYTGTSFSAQVKFQLTDNEKNVLDYDSATSTINCQYSNKTTQTSGKWDFTFDLVFTKAQIDAFSNTSTNFIQITYTYLSEEHTYEIPIVKNYAGADGVSGTPAYAVYLTNDFHLFAGSETVATKGQSVDFQIKVTYGGQESSYSSVTIAGIKIEKAGQSYDIIEGLTLTYNASTKTYTLTTSGDGNFLTKKGQLEIQVTLPNAYTYLCYFSYDINYGGKSYSLTPNESQIVYSYYYYKFKADNILLTATYRSGENNISFKEGYVTYQIDDDTETNLPANTSDKGSFSFDVAGKGVTQYTSKVVFRMYTDSTKSYLLDKVTLQVLTTNENIELGGENLLYYSKTFLNIAEAWEYTSASSTESDDGFTYLTATSRTWINSPVVRYNENYSGKDFCLSYLLKKEDTSLTHYAMLVFLNDDGEYVVDSDDDTFKQVLETRTNDSIEDGKLCKYFHVFKLNLQRNFLIRFTYEKATIGKPKLELGNIPSAWSGNIYDNEQILSSKIADINTSLEASVTGLTTNITNTFAKTANISLASDSGMGLRIITKVKDENELQASLSDEIINNMVFNITQYDKNGEPYVIPIIGANAFDNYIKRMNEQNATQLNTYSTQLVQTNLKPYTSSIIINPAHTKDDSTIEQGSITIKTSYMKTINDTDLTYTEALRLTSHRISFISSNEEEPEQVEEIPNEVAYISRAKFYIKEGQITDTLILGQTNATQHLKIYAADESSVAVVWE